MSQHDMVIDNGPGLAVRTDIVAAVQALASNNSGPTEPTTPYAGMFWLDTTTAPNGTVRMRNLANDAWIKLFDVVPGAPPSSTVSSTSDMSTRYRTGPNRWVINDAADGSGNDIFVVQEDGTVLVRQPDGTLKQVNRTALEPNIVVNPRFQWSQEQGAAMIVTTSLFAADQWQVGFAVNAGNPTYGIQPLTTDDWDIAEETPLHALKMTHGGTPTPSPAATNYFRAIQAIERSRMRVLGWFQPTAAKRKPAVLRFAAKVQNVAAPTTFSVTLRDEALSVTWVGEFTVQPADTGKWKQYSMAVPAPSAGSWSGVDADLGLYISFASMAGATYKAPAVGWNTGTFFAGPNQSNLIGAAGPNTLDIANVGLYCDPLGTGVAPPFQAKTPAEDLAECQRYYFASGGGVQITSSYASAAAQFKYDTYEFPVTMRAANPSVAFSGASYSNCSALLLGVATSNGFRTSVQSGGVGPYYASFNYAANARM